MSAAPLAVWDTRDGPGSPYWQHFSETSKWATEHFPDGAIDVYRAEFYLIDAPFAVLFCYAEDEFSRRFVDPGTREIAVREPVTMPLDELPPPHLLGAR